MSTAPLSWELLAAFRAVYRFGTLSAAARDLGLSQPTVRRQIETLEQLVGQPLFIRLGNGLQRIPETDALFREVEAMAVSAATFTRLASAEAQAALGVVRLTSSAVFAAEILPPALAILSARHPGIEVELSVSNTIENILRRDADVAVRLVRPDQDFLVAKRVAPVVFALYAAQGPLAERYADANYREVADSGYLIVQDRLKTMAEALNRLGFDMPSKSALRTDDDLAQLAAIRAGVGIGVTQAGIARRYGLVPICPDFTLPTEVWVTMHEDLRQLKRMRIIFDILVEHLSTSKPN
jgi:DNA-binding transcriptional LysR family regulator